MKSDGHAKPNEAKRFRFSSAYHSEARDSKLADYLERTRRNHFWVGGELGQRRVRNLRIAVAGLGGIGGQVADALVRLGVGHLRIADLDTVDRTNINRQAVATEAALGRNKARVMEENLRQVASDFELVVYDGGVDAPMVEEFVDGVNAVIDEIDVFALDRKVMLHRMARARGIPIYTAYVVGLGIRFYCFKGEQYTVEDFFGVPRGGESPARPTAEALVRSIGYPPPAYLDEPGMRAYETEIAERGVPIFGPATLLGHSLVATRVAMDLLGSSMARPGFEPTPVMPEFLQLDAADLSFRKLRAPSP